MAYTALYRKWRPLDFKHVVGQPHVVKTLKNALSSGRISHAYLFSGLRGTGKTSMAKILAKAVNCLNLEEGEPCNRCLNCERINQGNSMDILEIDAASNRGIDEIRDLREKIKLSPVEGRYKVYIIDEVHMLTPEAFNALLKTLEEPPAHVIFILATTEPHKIPLTILSRCQRFDFHRISTELIVKHLKEILAHHNLEAQEGALYLIAKIASGGMRDALSLLDQCLVSGSESITTELVSSIAGIVSEEYLFDLAQSILEADDIKCLTMLQTALTEGKEVKQLLADLLSYFRNLMLLQLGKGSEELVVVPQSVLAKLKAQSKDFSREDLLKAIKILAAAENEIKWSSQSQVLLEITLLKIIEDIRTSKNAEEGSQLSSQHLETPKTSSNKKQLPREDRAASTLKSVETEKPASKSIEEVEAKWGQILEAVRKAKIMCYAFFVEAKPVSLQDGVLILQYKADHKFHRERSELPENKKVVELAIEKILGEKIAVKCVLEEEPDKEGFELTPEDDVVEKAIALFGGEVIEIEQ